MGHYLLLLVEAAAAAVVTVIGLALLVVVVGVAGTERNPVLAWVAVVAELPVLEEEL